MIEIQKQVEMPEPNRRGTKKKYPFEKMEIGDSFFVPREEAPKFNSLRVYCYQIPQRLGINSKFCVRTERGGYRVFRHA